MPYLLVVSLVWAFSFGLIKGRLSGIDPTAVAVLRLVLSLLVFLPFVRLRAAPRKLQVRLAAIGAVQFGIMYVLYLHAFAYLQAFEVALFTITTPLFVALLDSAWERRFVPVHAIAAVLSVAGAAVIVWQHGATGGAVLGVLLVQASNLCFAAGQLAWKRVRARLAPETRDSAVFAWLYAGAVVSAARGPCLRPTGWRSA
jgi:drug/metabolite transporter (DMT)-like permease